MDLSFLYIYKYISYIYTQMNLNRNVKINLLLIQQNIESCWLTLKTGLPCSQLPLPNLLCIVVLVMHSRPEPQPLTQPRAHTHTHTQTHTHIQQHTHKIRHEIFHFSCSSFSLLLPQMLNDNEVDAPGIFTSFHTHTHAQTHTHTHTLSHSHTHTHRHTTHTLGSRSAFHGNNALQKVLNIRDTRPRNCKVDRVALCDLSCRYIEQHILLNFIISLVSTPWDWGQVVVQLEKLLLL